MASFCKIYLTLCCHFFTPIHSQEFAVEFAYSTFASLQDQLALGDLNEYEFRFVMKKLIFHLNSAHEKFLEAKALDKLIPDFQMRDLYRSIIESSICSLFAKGPWQKTVIITLNACAEIGLRKYDMWCKLNDVLESAKFDLEMANWCLGF